ncbi:hypothetical protein [Chamaesiphon polymorphus]|uniref:Uncharacterized protein n=1 Tax=Chamaesiphon polymorphus CCALA 037 TaxID=2107692 RepID=A0A2T1GAN7_9CYAN|nr:hypothetical protein [Chamaesiphon polymorphus]PSB54309.1 hypothetical protein C7B77_18535 [Chamaesiphon polymorphus CCALA 037]
MSDRIKVKGCVKKGYGVASGQAGNPRFPQGTIEMQKPFFRDRGLDLSGYFPGTINLSIAPCKYAVKQAKYTFKQVKWSPNDPAEDFSFFDCQILLAVDLVLDALIYYPHPETKPEHFQSPDILEIVAPFFSNLAYENELIITVSSQQINIEC